MQQANAVYNEIGVKYPDGTIVWPPAYNEYDLTLELERTRLVNKWKDDTYGFGFPVDMVVTFVTRTRTVSYSVDSPFA